MKNENQRGIALPIALLLVLLVSALAISSATLVSNESRFTLLDEAVVNAKYAAEAAAKIGIDMVTNNFITAGDFNDQSLITGKSTYDLTISNDLNNTVFINSTSRTPNGSGQAQVRVILAGNVNRIANPPQLLDLLNPQTASFSNGPWPITGTPLRANPPDGGYHQVLFNDQLQQNFRIDYSATLGQRVNTRDSATGYGIYYFASGTPNNMTAYVFQYDPGASLTDRRGRSDGGAFFVKKVIASNPPNPGGPWGNETQDFRRGFAENEDPNVLDNIDEGNIIRVSLNDLTTIMRGTSGHEDFENLNQSHSITIEVIDGHHYISCDGVRILSFDDKDSAHPIPTTNTGTGLRTWNARVNFFNNPSNTIGQNPPSRIIWDRIN